MLWFAAGNVAYVSSIQFQVEPPVPSLADIGYVGFYPFAYAATLAVVRRAGRVGVSTWLDGGLGALGAATALALAAPAARPALSPTPSSRSSSKVDSSPS